MSIKPLVSRLFFIAIFFGFLNISAAMFTLNKNDPAPFFSSIYPYFYLYNKQNTFQLPCPDECVEDLDYKLQLSFTPFYQRTNKGSDYCERCAELGDLTGRANMLALLDFEDSAEYVPQYLKDIKTLLLDCIATNIPDVSGSFTRPEQLDSIKGLLSLQNFAPTFGTYSIPIKYRKAGGRFQGAVMFNKILGARIDVGVANISQCPKFISQNYYCPTAPCTEPVCEVTSCDSQTINPLNCKNPLPQSTYTDAEGNTIKTGLDQNQWQQVVACVENDVMGNLKTIADSINLDICRYTKTSIEDIHAELFFREGIEFGSECSPCWSNVLLVPFASIGGSVSTAPERNQNILFSLPNGNNGHNSVDMRVGFSAAFKGTLEASMEGGFTHFFPKCFRDYRIPTDDYQKFIYPFSAPARVNPGKTWHIGLAMNAYHFIDNLSFWAQYLFVDHDEDKICILDNPNNIPFKPEKLECLTPFKNHLGTVAFNYDFTPQVALGCLWQFSMKRANAYNSNTFLISLILSGFGSCN